VRLLGRPHLFQKVPFMQLVNSPAKLVLPFANAGGKNSIPTASQIGITPGAASLTDGFPPLTRTPIAAGGVPPSGLDMNGVLYSLSAIVRWANAGAGYVYDSSFATDSNVSGYPKGARVLRSDGTGYWFNTTDGNTTDPEGAGAIAAGWVPDFTTGAASVTMTNANVTLTAAQYGKPIVVITGTLTANLNLIFPSIVGEWIVVNNTTGAYTITCKTAAGTGVVVNSAQFIFGDATNIYSAYDAIASNQSLIASAGGTADAITATFSPAPRIWPNGVPFMVRAASANATTTPTFTANSGVLTAKTIVKGANTTLAVGDIAGAGHWLELQYDSTLDKVVLLNPATGIANTTPIPRSYLSGLTLATAGASTTMSIASGQATDSTNVVVLSLSAINKTTASWVVGTGNGGLDTGSIANNTWYYFYIIRRPDTGVVDVVFSTNSTNPTLPTNYTQYRYIGGGLTNGSGQWTKFVQIDNEFWWDTPILEYSTGSPTNTRLTLTCTIPRGRKMKGHFHASIDGGGGGNGGFYFSDLSNADLAPSTTATPLAQVYYSGTASGYAVGPASVWTNTSAQIGHREVGTSTARIVTLGWTDLRGKDL